jgi:hypothetical protein
MSYQRNLRKVNINTSAIGNTTLVPGNQLGAGIGTIRVWKFALESTGANTITFYSGTTAQGNPQAFLANGATSFALKDEQPYFEALPGQDLIINSSTTAGVTGTVWYSLA